TGLLTSVLTGGGLLTRLLRTGPAVFVGRVSYGMYLLHGLGTSAAQRVIRPGSGRLELRLLTFALAALATVLLAWIVAILGERPCLRLGRRWSEGILRRETEAAMGELVVPHPVKARPRRWFRTFGRAR